MEWRSIPLERVLLEAGSGTWGSEPDGSKPTYPVLRSTNIHDGRLVLDDLAHRSMAGKTAQRYELRDGDILVTTSSGSRQLLGKNAIVQGLSGRYLFSNFTWRLRPDPERVVSKFLFYYLNSSGARAELERAQSTTSGLRNLNTRLYLVQAIPLPPLSEQNRIVEILDHADLLRRLSTQADEKAERILPALLARALGSPAKGRSEQRFTPLEKLVEPVSGATPSKGDERFWSGDVPWVSPKDMKQDFLSDSEDHVSEAALDETNLRLVDEGNVLIVVRGMILARDIPVAINLRPLTINQDMKVLVPRTTDISGAYIWAALRIAKQQLQTLVRTAGHGTRKLDTPDLMQFPIPSPDPERVKRVVTVVEHHRLAIEQRQRRATLVERLFAITLRRAFDSSLTSTWRKAHLHELLREIDDQSKVLATA